LISVAQFSEFTNVIPVIAKRDTFTVSELKQIKRDIMREVYDYQKSKKIYSSVFFDIEKAIDNTEFELKEKNEIIKECLFDGHGNHCPPFAILNPSDAKRLKDGSLQVGREYEYGFCNAFDKN